MSLLRDFPVLVKEIDNDRYHIRLEQHADLYVVKYNGKSLNPFSSLTVALDVFEKLLDKQDKINYN